MVDFNTLITTRGQSKLSTSVSLSQMAVGSGENEDYYVLTGNETALKNEVYRGAINSLYAHPTNANWIVAELAIPVDVGGWTIREAAVYDTNGELFAIGIIPASFKPVLSNSQRANKTVVVQLILAIQDVANVTMLVDSSTVYATHEYVATAIRQGISDAVDLHLLPNGYAILTNVDGQQYIRQWGRGEMNSEGYCDVTFPIEFPNGVLSVSATPWSSHSDSTLRAVAYDYNFSANNRAGGRFVMRAWSGGRTFGGFFYEVIGR